MRHRLLLLASLACWAPRSAGHSGRTASKEATAAAQELLEDGLATKRTLQGSIDKGNVHIVEATVAKWEEALAVYEAALPSGNSPLCSLPARV